MPAMHLIIVDLPAPLSPTNAVTSPARATRSTPRSACTAPKFLRPPRTSRVGGGARSGAACAAWVIVHLVVSLGSPRVVAGLCGRARAPGWGRPLPRTGPACHRGGRQLEATPVPCSGDASLRASVGKLRGADLVLRGVAVRDDVLDVVRV